MKKVCKSAKRLQWKLYFSLLINKIWQENQKDKTPSNEIVIIWDYHESLWDVYKIPCMKRCLVEIIANEIQTILNNKNFLLNNSFLLLIIIIRPC